MRAVSAHHFEIAVLELATAQDEVDVINDLVVEDDNLILNVPLK